MAIMRTLDAMGIELACPQQIVREPVRRKEAGGEER
jgi:hypothetical protein